MTTIRAMVVEDELNARRKLRQFIEAEPDIELIGEFGACEEAVAGIAECRPDLLFLDVRLRNATAFDIIERVGAERMPGTVFVTAYDTHAVRAFEVDAVDYLVKPFDRERFRAAVRRARVRLAAAQTAPADGAGAAAGPRHLERLMVRRTDGATILLPTRDIEWVAAAGNYVRLHCGGTSHLHRQPLSSLEEQLDPHRFVRVHRSAMVNLDFVEYIRPYVGGDYLVRVRSGADVRLSRHFRKAFDQAVGQHGP